MSPVHSADNLRCPSNNSKETKSSYIRGHSLAYLLNLSYNQEDNNKVKHRTVRNITKLPAISGGISNL